MEELKKLLKKFEDENRIEDYNKLKKLLEDEHVEIVDVLHKEDEVSSKFSSFEKKFVEMLRTLRYVKEAYFEPTESP